MNREVGFITPEQAGTLGGLLRERARRSPTVPAYRHYDAARNAWFDRNWTEVTEQVARWQAALEQESLRPGDRVAVMLRNCPEWVYFDQAALGLGLVVVPLYTEDRAENVAYILNDAGARVLLIAGQEHWDVLNSVRDQLSNVQCIVTLDRLAPAPDDARVSALDDWLAGAVPHGHTVREDIDPAGLATIVYTSGTTGRPKGVMLSHHNILWNAYAGLQSIPVASRAIFLSFLPLSHTLERTIGYYLPMMCGGSVAYARSIPQLAEDLLSQRPHGLISVPRIYERVYNRVHEQLAHKPAIARLLFRSAVEVGWQRFEYQQGRRIWQPKLLLWPLLDLLVARKIRARLGGRLEVAICGGAPLSPDVARMFIGLGIPLAQGYGLTETSPVISVNRLEDNEPASVGTPLVDVEVKVTPAGELHARSPGVMLGYWNQSEATQEMIDGDRWLHTGDKARLERGHIYLTGRVKEIIVLATGEKVPPSDMEMAIALDPLVDQVLVLGEARPYLTAIVVLNPEQWQGLCAELQCDASDSEVLRAPKVEQAVLERIGRRLSRFPGYAQIHHVTLSTEPWTVESGLVTPTLKSRRTQILERFKDDVERMYEGH